MSEGRQTVAGAYAKMEAHEDLCAERYGSIHAAINDLKADSKSSRNLIAALVLSLIAWLASQVYTDLKATRQAAPAPAAVPAPLQPGPAAAP